MAAAFFWHGVRLLGTKIGWIPTPIPLSPIEKQGTSRITGRLGVRSRNYLWTIVCKTQIEPRSAIVRADALDADRSLAFNLDVVQFYALMLSHSRTLGDLSLVEDDAEVITPSAVTNPGSYPNPLTVTYVTSGFTPLVDCYILARDPITGEGYVRRCTGIGAGTFTIENMPVAVTTSWRFVLVRIHFPDSAWDQPAPYEIPSQGDNAWAPDFQMSFRSQAEAAVYATQYVRDLG